MKKIISIGCDHAGYSLKLEIKEQLVNLGYEVLDMGCYSEESIDYPDFAHPVADYVENNTDGKGILICGSGNGINMAANKHQGIRSALCWQVEIAKLAREHNNANIVALPARFISSEEALKIVEVFLNTPFEGGRHQKRVDKIACV
jgi:ribose 5-phosphate isomerase B